MTNGEVRTRFAPSPTGYMHVGNLRTALYAYLLAKSKGGKFILRIEDTDQERYVEGAVEIIYNTLRETGLVWDEGPDIGGPVGPYIQSERMGMYAGYAEQLIKSGHAYRCFCEKERLEEVRKLQAASGISPKYDGHCSRLSPQEIEDNLAAGLPYVVRQKIPETGSTTFHDLVFGDVTVENTTLDDQVLIKRDGMPTYNFANVVDDHLMGITHVIRGNEYLSSTPKYNLLYEAFGWEIPFYIHCSPVMKNATEKLSKRHGDASYGDLVDAGYLGDAVLNYIALLGWSPGGENEIFTLEGMVAAFDAHGISKSPAIFDTQKLRHINGEYIRRLSPEEFARIAAPWIKKSVSRTDVDLALVAQVLQARTEALADIPEQVDFIDALPEYDTAMYVSKKMKTTIESSCAMLRELLPVLNALDDFSVQPLHDALFELIARLEVKNGAVLWPLRIAVSGKQFTPGGGIEICSILGKSDTLARVEKGIELLEAVCG
ncbi:MAG: glutamate--tRNA ligase [Acetanaerobacterium sp.]